ncbi:MULTISPECIES: dihydrodipicolinate synthase family protein [Pseudomonas]|uniref:Dihydrodipicolinate synthase family protein n=1 Tax=Pseudomonas oryzihabitans TaxID=47885 RepID=A0A2Z5ADP8_9PSED|nr:MULTISPECIES: dihydrodipicolinate synthase family protein [Pseudomonas]AXA68076.1 dihydrodipicolinate synthase family protein [Pseudomonas oryzihabitans]MDK8263426.1 dihydrodipicolinate synthase family protein [Pseudomonas oryzihabitans]
MSKEFRGSYGVTVTPFTADGSQIDYQALAAFIEWQIESGSPGIIILGTTGEFLTISDDERAEYIETTVKLVNGRIDVLVGTMNAYTPNAVRYSREAEALGADGFMIAPPYYYTPTEDEIFNYYRAISEATSLPIMLYNNPVTTNVDMSAALVARMTKAFDNVRYIKEASMDVGRIYDIVEGTEGVMNVFAGERPVESFLLGAVGYVNPYANYIPRASTRMWEALVEGKLQEAGKIQAMISSFDHIIAEGHPTYGHQCYSKALAASQGYPVGDVRAPLTQFADLGQEGMDRRARIVSILDDLNSYVAAQAAK